MIGRKRLLRVTAVLSVAVATGQTVESLRSSAAVLGGANDVASVDARLPGSASLRPTGLLADIKGITPVAAAPVASGADACKPSMNLRVADRAMIEVTLLAPCDAGERIVLRHAGISFTEMMGPDGRISLTLPALEREALVSAYFEGSAVALASVEVPEVAYQSRFAFQAPYPVEFQIRVEPGETQAIDRPGSVMTLGSDRVAQPLLAQVYTFPGIDLAASRLSVDVRITDQTCSRSFVAETRISEGGAVTALTQSIAVPICGTSGDILVLKNLLPALTLASPN
jgi:hypothetical protein